MAINNFELLGGSPAHADLHERRQQDYQSFLQDPNHGDYLYELQDVLDTLTEDDYTHMTLAAGDSLSSLTETYHYVAADTETGEIIYRYVRFIEEETEEGLGSTYVVAKQVSVDGEVQYERYFALTDSSQGLLSVGQSMCYPMLRNGIASEPDGEVNDPSQPITTFDVDYLFKEVIAMMAIRNQDK